MELRSKFIINSLVGFIAGMLVGIVIWLIPPVNSEGRSLLLHVIVSGIHGLIPCGAATVYEIESWGLTRSTVVHASLTLATILAIDLPMKWFRWGWEFAIAMAVYVVIYMIIWLVNYLYWKHTVKEMNDQLEILHKYQGKNTGRV
ncbi:MAG: DUF3021 domain-containing protein [Lachnospiraceae bacterium]|nr:DUF3021 domain-containing protein [Lachnospiraceae bacterium]